MIGDDFVGLSLRLRNLLKILKIIKQKISVRLRAYFYILVAYPIERKRLGVFLRLSLRSRARRGGSLKSRKSQSAHKTKSETLTFISKFSFPICTTA